MQQDISIATYFKMLKKSIKPIVITLLLIVGAIIFVSFILNESYTFLYQKLNNMSISETNNITANSMLYLNILGRAFTLFINVSVFYMHYLFSKKFIDKTEEKQSVEINSTNTENI